MASSISPLGSTPGLAPVGLAQPQRSRADGEERTSAPTPAVEADVSSWRGARDAARSGQATLALSAAAARQLASRLDDIAGAARDGRADDAAAASAEAKDQIAAAIKAGATLVGGQSLRLELGGQPLVIDGVDLQFEAPPRGLLSAPGVADTLASAATQAAAQARDLATQWDKAAQRVSAHEGVLAAADRLGQGAARDLDADGARLMALQVRQSMADSGLAIANSDPQAILALFKS